MSRERPQMHASDDWLVTFQIPHPHNTPDKPPNPSPFSFSDLLLNIRLLIIYLVERGY